MRFNLLSISALLIVASTLGACAAPQTSVMTPAPPLLVPSSSMVATASAHGTINPYSVLPEYETELFDFPRDERFVWSSLPTGESVAATVYTYDAQQISGRWGNGYRYRWEVKQSSSLP